VGTGCVPLALGALCACARVLLGAPTECVPDARRPADCVPLRTRCARVSLDAHAPRSPDVRRCVPFALARVLFRHAWLTHQGRWSGCVPGACAACCVRPHLAGCALTERAPLARVRAGCGSPAFRSRRVRSAAGRVCPHLAGHAQHLLGAYAAGRVRPHLVGCADARRCPGVCRFVRCAHTVRSARRSWHVPWATNGTLSACACWSLVLRCSLGRDWTTHGCARRSFTH